jgi:hypothetical protein
MTANQTKLLTCETYYYDVLTATPTANIYYLQGKITIKNTGTMSIVTIIIDENSAQSAIEAAAAAQQALQEINESGLVETVRQPYTTFKRIQKVLETLI